MFQKIVYYDNFIAEYPISAISLLILFNFHFQACTW